MSFEATFILAVGMLLGLIAVFVVFGLYMRRHRSESHAEYWVYVRAAQLPPQDAVMAWLMEPNRFPQRPGPTLTHAQSLILSDVRLRIGYVRKDRNAHLFSVSEDAPDALERARIMRESVGIVRLRYTSPGRLLTKHHLAFLLAACAAYAELGEGLGVTDVVTDIFLSADEFKTWIAQPSPLDAEERHVAVLSTWQEDSVTYSTRGLTKIGLPEVTTARTETDHSTLLADLFAQFCAEAWRDSALPMAQSFQAYGDHFQFQGKLTAPMRMQVRVFRYQIV